MNLFCFECEVISFIFVSSLRICCCYLPVFLSIHPFHRNTEISINSFLTITLYFLSRQNMSSLLILRPPPCLYYETIGSCQTFYSFFLTWKQILWTYAWQHLDLQMSYELFQPQLFKLGTGATDCSLCMAQRIYDWEMQEIDLVNKTGQMTVLGNVICDWGAFQSWC